MWEVVWLIEAKLHSHHPGHFSPYPLRRRALQRRRVPHVSTIIKFLLIYSGWTGLCGCQAANSVASPRGKYVDGHCKAAQPCRPLLVAFSVLDDAADKLVDEHPVRLPLREKTLTGMRRVFWDGLAPVRAPFTLNGTHQDYTDCSTHRHD